MKFASIVPPRREELESALNQKPEKCAKKRKSAKKKIDKSAKKSKKCAKLEDARILDSLIPTKLSYLGHNNPFHLG